MKRKGIPTLLAALCLLAAIPAAAQAAFGLQSVGGSLARVGGEPELQAGAHPETTFSFRLNEEPEPNKFGTRSPQGNVKDVQVKLPPGLIGNPTATPKCSQSDLIVLVFTANCDPSAQVGFITIDFEGTPQRVPLYNMEAPVGVAGQFAFNFVEYLGFIDASVTAEGGYRLRADVANIAQTLPVNAASVTLWGVPASPAHRFERPLRGQLEPPVETEVLDRKAHV